MPNYRLTYFDMHGGRGEPIRLAFAIGGIPFEDDRVSFEAWPSRKPGTPFGSVPVLEMDGKTLAQSNTITRYAGKLAGLYPSDPWEAALCDEAMDAVEDVIGEVGATMFLPEEEKKARREALAKGPFPFYLERLQRNLEANGGEYFAGDSLTIADLKVAILVRMLRSGVLDHLPADLPDRHAPKLVAHYARVMDDPRVMAYYAKLGVEM